MQPTHTILCLYCLVFALFCPSPVHVDYLICPLKIAMILWDLTYQSCMHLPSRRRGIELSVLTYSPCYSTLEWSSPTGNAPLHQKFYYRYGLSHTSKYLHTGKPSSIPDCQWD
jgi:hypothetical protein